MHIPLCMETHRDCSADQSSAAPSIRVSIISYSNIDPTISAVTLVVIALPSLRIAHPPSLAALRSTILERERWQDLVTFGRVVRRSTAHASGLVATTIVARLN